jgi:hypothetical protein
MVLDLIPNAPLHPFKYLLELQGEKKKDLSGISTTLQPFLIGSYFANKIASSRFFENDSILIQLITNCILKKVLLIFANCFCHLKGVYFILNQFLYYIACDTHNYIQQQIA